MVQSRGTNGANQKAELAAPKMTDKGAVKEVEVTAAGRKQEGTFVELEGAKMGEVVTRFQKQVDFFILVMRKLVYSMHVIKLHSRFCSKSQSIGKF